MAEQTIRVNVPDGYEVVRVGVPNNGELILSNGEVIASPPTVYDRVIVRKTISPAACGDADDLVVICQRADTLRAKVMQTWEPPCKFGNEPLACIAQTATMQTIAWIMGPEFMGKLSRDQQKAIDSGMLLFRAAFEDAKA